MPTPRENNIWASIRVQLTDAQKYILDGRYGEAVIAGREIIRSLVRMQMNEAVLVSTDLRGDIDQLFENRVIGTESRERYQAIAQVAEQAEAGAQIDAQLANDVFSLVSRELSDYVEKTQRAEAKAQSAYEQDGGHEPEQAAAAEGFRAPGQDYQAGAQEDTLDIPKGRRSEETERPRVRAQKSSGNRRSTGSARSGKSTRNGQRSSSSQRSGRRSSARRSGRRYQEEEQVRELDLYSILKVAIPLVCVILVIVLIRVLLSGGEATVQTTAAPTVQESIVEETTPAETEPVEETTVEETTEAPRRWFTTDGVRVRTRPSTENSEVLDVLDPGTELNYKGTYDNDWIIIDFNGQEAYVASAYTRSEAIS